MEGDFMNDKKRHEVVAMELFYRSDPNIRDQNRDIVDNAIRMGLIGLATVVAVGSGIELWGTIPAIGMSGLQLCRLIKSIGVQTKYINEVIEFANEIENESQNTNEEGKQR